MIAIAKREFLKQFKSMKSILIIVIMLFTTYFVAKYAGSLVEFIDLSDEETVDVHALGFVFIIIFMGQLFVMSLSHDVLNKEIYERTMRFLVTRTSRTSIVIGKFIGIWLFWFSCVLIAYTITTFFSHRFNVILFLQSISLLSLQITLAMLLSILIPRPSLSMFLGVILGIVFPIFSLWATTTGDEWYGFMKYLSPFTYLTKYNYQFLMLFIGAGIVLLLINRLFKGRAC